MPARPTGELDDLDPDFPDIDGVVLDGRSVSLADARTLTVLRSRLSSCDLDVPAETTLDAQDAAFADMDLTGRRIDGMNRVVFTRCRLGGVDCSDSELRDVVFDDCVLELASLRLARLERVRIDGGRITEVDLSGARLKDVTFTGVDLGDVTWAGARLDGVDITGADVTALRDVSALRGALINEVQAISLARRLAQALGLGVVDDSAGQPGDSDWTAPAFPLISGQK